MAAVVGGRFTVQSDRVTEGDETGGADLSQDRRRQTGSNVA